MITLLAKWCIAALSVFLAAHFVPGITVASLYTALVVAALLGLLNLTAKPILLLLTLPLTVVTLGLFALVINAVLLWFLGTIVQGFVVEGFLAAFLGALIIAIGTRLGSMLFRLD